MIALLGRVLCLCFTQRIARAPFFPAAEASSAVHWWAVPRACEVRPPLLAISRRRSGLIAASPLGRLGVISTIISSNLSLCALLDVFRSGQPFAGGICPSVPKTSVKVELYY